MRTESSDWIRVSIGAVGELIRGLTYKKHDASTEAEAGRLPILRATNITDDGLVLDRDLVYVPESLPSKEQILRAGDIIIATSSGSAKVVGKAAQLNQPWQGSFGGFCMAFRPNPEIVDPRWVDLFFQSRSYRRSISALASGTNINNIKREHLTAMEIPLPDIETQRSVVAVADRLLHALGSAEQDVTDVLHLLPRLRVAQLRDLTGLDEAPSIDLGDTVEVLDHKRVPVNRDERAERAGDVPYYGATGQVGWIDEPLFNEELVLLGEDGIDFLNPLAAKAYVIDGPSWVNNHAHVLRPRKNVVRADYLCSALNGISYEGLANGTTRLKLTKSAMLRIKLRVPATELQDEIMKHHNAIERLRATAGSDADKAASMIQTLRGAVVDAALAGQLYSANQNDHALEATV